MKTSYEIQLCVKDVLEERGMSIRELSRRISGDFESVRTIVNGKSVRLPLETMAKICEVLECDLTDVMKLQRKAPN